jgi:hypothetical protein
MLYSYNEGINSLLVYKIPTIRKIISRILPWAGYVARFGDKTTQDSVRVHHMVISCEDRNCMEVTQDYDQWHVFILY